MNAEEEKNRLFEIILGHMRINGSEYCSTSEFESDIEDAAEEIYTELATLCAQLAEAQKAVNEAADIFQFVAYEDMQIMENGYQAEEMASHWISKYSNLVITA